jgi:acetyltransferase
VTPADASRVSPPRPVPEPSSSLATQFGALWFAVNRAGGAVGFRPDSPAGEVRAAAERAVEDVRAGRLSLLASSAGADVALAGVVFLRRDVGPVVGHRAEVSRLMVHPDLQGHGLGRRLLVAAERHAAALGVEQLMLSTRGGTPLPGFYAGLGWTEVGVFPGQLRLSPDDVRDEHWFVKPVQPGNRQEIVGGAG